jgi:tetratricopeptide (TPR) repeat protein
MRRWAILLLLLAAPARAADSSLEDGFARSRAGQWAEAAPLLRRAFDADPGRANVAAELGFVLYKLGQGPEAETYLRRAIALDPASSYPYLTLADLLAEAPDRWRRREEIIATLERGLSWLKDEAGGRTWLTLRLAAFERSVGMLAQAQRRLAGLLATPEVPATLRQQALDLRAQITADSKAQGLEDWPEGPPLGEADKIAVKRAGAALDNVQPGRAVELLTPVLARVPESVEARWLRARAFEDQGRYEQAKRDLTLLLQLRPSHAAAWRRLGIMLADHGGSLEAEAADEALRHALALEPSWDDLRERRRKVALKRGATEERKAAPTRPAAPPTPRALQLLADAQRWRADEAPEFAEPLVAQALAESPGFVDAAAALYALTGNVPDATVRALWDDPDGLVRLAVAVKDIGGRPSPAVERALDRAIELGSSEARWRRGELRAATGDRAGALADLTDYVAREPNPAHLDEARALRATLVPSDGALVERQAFLALLADRAPDAERLLGGPCRAELPSSRLVELGRVQEYAGALGPALACYRMAVEAASKSGPPQALRAAQTRLAAAAARAPLELVAGVEAPLRAAHRAQIPTAAWALARLERQQSPDEARNHLESFLVAAAPDDPAIPVATAMLKGLTESDRATASRRLGVSAVVGAGLLAALLLAIARRFRGITVPRALARRPALFPELSRAVAEVRHDVIKHRASVLEAGDDQREEMARALLEPQPASTLVGEIYARVEQAAVGLGLTLRPLDREPTFGPIARALRKAERILRNGAGGSLLEIDRELREEHGPRLGELLTLGPRTELDAETLTRWIRAVEAELPGGTEPGLLLRHMDLAVGVDETALYTIFANLLRNAEQAVAERPEPRILVRVERETDVTGRQLVTILVADSAPHTPLLTPSDIEKRDGQRGLGLVRDLTRKWGGHLAIRNEAAPLVKAIGASFPAAGATAP